MRPLHIRASNVLVYRELDLDLSPYTSLVITGENGAGKSLLLDCLRVALFDFGRIGRPGTALANMIGQWSDKATLEVDFEHGGRVYRTTRTRRRTAKTLSRTDVLQLWDGSDWTPCPHGVDAVLGATADTIGATTFLRSRGMEGLGDFGSSAPKDRKDVLSTLRRTGRYVDFLEAARSRANATDAAIAVASQRAQALRADAEAARQVAARAPSLMADLAQARTALEAAELRLAQARTARARRDELRRERDAASRDAMDADEALRRHEARIRELSDRIAGHQRVLADAETVRAAVRERAAVGDQWRAAHAATSAARAAEQTARVAVTAAEQAVRDAARAADDARATNERADKADQAAADLVRLDAEIENLEPRVMALRTTREALRVAETRYTAAQRENEAADRVDAVAARLAETERDLALLEPVRDAARELFIAQDTLGTHEKRASGLATVPCGGGGEFAACRYLTEAVAARDALDVDRQRATALLDKMRTATRARPDLRAHIESGEYSPLESALQAVRAERASLEGQLRGLGTHERVDLAPLAEAVAFAREALAELGDIDESRLEQLRHRRAVTVGSAAALGRPVRVDLGPLLAAVDAAIEARAAAADAVERAAAKVQECAAVEAALLTRGTEVAAVAHRLAEVEAASGALTADAESLAREGDGAAHRERLQRARARLAEAERALFLADDEDDTGLREAVERCRHDVAGLARDLAAAEAAEATATARDAEATAAEAEYRAHTLQRAEYTVLERFYREAPALILENDRTAIEKAANDWLAKTSDLQVELVFQRALKTDASRMAETLDIDVLRPSGKAARETCSAGEMFRVDVGLAVGIGRAMGNGRPWLAIDEGFGALKGDALTQVTRELESMIPDLEGLWVVEHNQSVIDLFPTRLHVRRNPDGASTVAVVTA